MPEENNDDLPDEDFDDLIEAPRMSRRTLLKGVGAGGAIIAAGASLFGGGFLTRLLTEPGSKTSSDVAQKTYAELLPKEGIAVNATWGDLMPRMVAAGALDPVKFAAAERRPLTDIEQRILTSGADEPIRINADNAHFVLNALWGVGIANRNPILTTTGPMATLATEKRGQLASTGGWTLGQKPGGEYLAQFDLIPATESQQQVLEQVAMNSYRPCCSNPTAFPDCNHGAAGLAMAELAAAAGASADEIFAALKGFNSFWYPNQYYVLARYFERRGTPWPKTDAKLVLSANYSSGQGWQKISAQLQQEEPVQGVPGGGGCSA